MEIRGFVVLEKMISLNVDCLVFPADKSSDWDFIRQFVDLQNAEDFRQIIHGMQGQRGSKRILKE